MIGNDVGETFYDDKSNKLTIIVFVYGHEMKERIQHNGTKNEISDQS